MVCFLGRSSVVVGVNAGSPGAAKARGGKEAPALADVDEDPRADAGHRVQDLRRRVNLQQPLDPPGQHFALARKRPSTSWPEPGRVLHAWAH